jgi:hypothetical protein
VLLQRMVHSLGMLETVCAELSTCRKTPPYDRLPVMSWPEFMQYIRAACNPLALETHCKQLIQQLQLIGEVVYLKNDTTNCDYVIINVEWLCVNVIGQLLSYDTLQRCRPHGVFMLSHLPNHPFN